MKVLNIKKLAAIATGAALLGTALAPVVSAMSLESSDIYDASGGPVVNVVVGSLADISDVVWGGNIATKIAEHAYSVKAPTCELEGDCAGGATADVTDLEVTLTVGGSVTYANAETYKSGEDTGTFTMASVQDAKEFPGLLLSKAQLPHLYKKQVSMKWAGTAYTRTFREYIGVDADVRFDYDNTYVNDLELELKGTHDFNYIVDLAQGIPWYDSPGSTTDFSDGTNDNVRIPIFGNEYLLRSASYSGLYVKLIKDSASEEYLEGEVISGLKGKGNYDGQEVTVKIESIVSIGPTDPYQARFKLYDAEGNLVDTRDASATANLNEEFVDEDGDYALKSILYVDAITIGSTTQLGSVKVTKGTNVVELHHGKDYPYDPSNTTGPYDWQVNFSSYDTNYLKVITIGNAAKLYKGSHANYNPLYAPSSQALTATGQEGPSVLKFLDGRDEDIDGYGYAEIEFEGFEADEALATHEIKADSVYTTVIHYYDNSGYEHSIPFVIPIESDTSTTEGRFSFDGETILYKSSCPTSGMTFDVNALTSAYLNGVAITKLDINGWKAGGGTSDANIELIMGGRTMDINTLKATHDGNSTFDINGTIFKVTAVGAADSNTMTVEVDCNATFAKASIDTATASDFFESNSGNALGGNTAYTKYFTDNNNLAVHIGNYISLQGNNDVVYEYAMFVKHTGGSQMYLLLADATNFRLRYRGDLVLEGTDTDEDMAIDRGYYWPDTLHFGGGSDASHYIATFTVDTNDTTYHPDMNFYVDTSTHKLPTFPNADLSNYNSDVNVQYGPVKFGMDKYDATIKPQKAYNDYGAYMEITDDMHFKFQIPENIRRAVLVVKGEGTTTEITGGEEVTVAEGETETTETGTQVTLDEVLYTATCVGGDGNVEEATCVASPSSYMVKANVPNPLVYLDVDAPLGTNVIVGGPVVNALAAQISGLADLLATAGSYVAEVQESGDIVIAGCNKTDTGTAAQELINAVDALA